MERTASVALLATAAVLAACGLEEPTDDGTGGVANGGAAGSTAGKSGGTAGTAAGSAGTGGTAANTGGASGTGGAAGALSAGGAGGTAGTGGATAGASMGGTSGSGGSTAGLGGTSAGGSSAGSSGAGAGGAVAGGAAGTTGGTAGGANGGSAGSAGSAGGSAGSGGSAGGSAGTGKSAGCGKSRTLMNGRKTIQSGGQNREYILRVPDNYDNQKPYRLIMAYHWLNGNANQVAEGGNGGSTEDPYYGLWDLANNSTIFVAPEGLNAGWQNSNNRDIDLTDAILEQVQNDLCIDTTRIFATGFSYGAGMSYALACARANVFRGVALYAGAQLSGCTGGNTPIAYFHAHGLSDSVLNISQGRQLRDRFVQVNGCTMQNPPEPSSGSGTHTCTSYQGCMDGYPVRWCAFDGDHNPTQKDRGQNKSWVPNEAWEFISQF